MPLVNDFTVIIVSANLKKTYDIAVLFKNILLFLKCNKLGCCSISSCALEFFCRILFTYFIILYNLLVLIHPGDPWNKSFLLVHFPKPHLLLSDQASSLTTQKAKLSS